MIHPHTELKYINDTIGYGVFAKQDILEGTIVYVKDSLESCISPAEFLTHSQEMQEIIEKYSYRDPSGNRIVSWDFAKYVNHCCYFNTISTGYGFEMAIRDIYAGEQITDEYTLFNLESPMPVDCGQYGCRKVVNPEDFETYYEDWDKLIKKSLVRLFDLEQPLIGFLDDEIVLALDEFFKNRNSYRSVYALKTRDMNLEGQH